MLSSHLGYTYVTPGLSVSRPRSLLTWPVSCFRTSWAYTDVHGDMYSAVPLTDGSTLHCK